MGRTKQQKEEEEEEEERVFENSHSRRCKKSKEIISMQVTNEHVHDDSKVLPAELVENIIKSNKIIGKLFADDGASMMVMIFLDA